MPVQSKQTTLCDGRVTEWRAKTHRLVPGSLLFLRDSSPWRSLLVPTSPKLPGDRPANWVSRVGDGFARGKRSATCGMLAD